MKLTSQQLIEIVVAFCVYFGVAYALNTFLPARFRAQARYGTVAVGIALFFYGLHRYIDEHARAVDLTKVLIALGAALCVFYEAQREGMRRPIAERWKRFVGVALGVAAIVSYFNGFRFGYPKYYHRWDQFHYYMGAKYFPEMGYDGLYKCALIAQDELGLVTYTNEDTGRQVRLDMAKEVRHPDKKIRNLGGDNLLLPASEVLAHPEVCSPNAAPKEGAPVPAEARAHFTPERWEMFKRDVQFFRTSSDKTYWEDMQKDHGYNPPPVWTIMGKFWADLHPASTTYLQFLASFDILYLLGMFAAIYWAFGWRVFSVAAIFWGCQASAPFYWTGGAFLRQDWLFFLVLSACLIRKRYYKLAGASMVYAGLLRIFPGLAVIGWLTVAGIYIARHKRMARTHVQVLIGGVLAAAVLIPASIAVSGKDSYRQFYEHTLEVHDQTPLTNHMGLRVLIAHKPGTGVESGRMKYTKDTKLVDPFEVWKRMRNERYAKYRWVAYAVIAASFAAFVYVCRRIRSLWVAQCLGQVFIILLSQLTCYYYSFMILCAPLTRLKRQIEVPLFGLAALSQFIWMASYWNDDKYTALTAVSLAFCYYLLCVFSGKPMPWERRREPETAAVGDEGDQATSKA
ncbi:hypothetical protein [Sorangium sp. So ce131]|uniref:hypothetical protein n=1 Tax=Sorangium sp. So ce131 TaxID=3133282 RepID=UPI003F610284